MFRNLVAKSNTGNDKKNSSRRPGIEPCGGPRRSFDEHRTPLDYRTANRFLRMLLLY